MHRSRFSFAVISSLAAAALLAVVHAGQDAYSYVRNVLADWTHFLCSPDPRPAHNDKWPRVTQVSIAQRVSPVPLQALPAYCHETLANVPVWVMH
jgi:hypothetical protein